VPPSASPHWWRHNSLTSLRAPCCAAALASDGRNEPLWLPSCVGEADPHLQALPPTKSQVSATHRVPLLRCPTLAGGLPGTPGSWAWHVPVADLAAWWEASFHCGLDDLTGKSLTLTLMGRHCHQALLFGDSCLFNKKLAACNMQTEACYVTLGK
jgi:hypothetical protein